MLDLPVDLRIAIERITKTSIHKVNHVGGGSINEARSLTTSSGKLFLKMNQQPDANKMFQAEASGLNIIANTNTIAVPTVRGYNQIGSTSFLLLDFIDPGHRSDHFWEQLGIGLARLHQCTKDDFGLDHHNYIGSLHQSNKYHDNWVQFYIQERLQPQLRLAIDQQLLTIQDNRIFEDLFRELPNLLPKENPSLIHGDLWSGNFLCDTQSLPYLIDPAVYFGSREVDLAMSYLFGGFSPTFYQAYEHFFPLLPGFNKRMELYQLYYLLVHVNLFGMGYVSSVRNIIKTHKKRV